MMKQLENIQTILETLLTGVCLSLFIKMIISLSSPRDYNNWFWPDWKFAVIPGIALLTLAIIGARLLALADSEIALLLTLVALIIIFGTAYKDRTTPKTLEGLKDDPRFTHCRCHPAEQDEIVAAYIMGATVCAAANSFWLLRRKWDYS